MEEVSVKSKSTKKTTSKAKKIEQDPVEVVQPPSTNDNQETNNKMKRNLRTRKQVSKENIAEEETSAPLLPPPPLPLVTTTTTKSKRKATTKSTTTTSTTDKQQTIKLFQNTNSDFDSIDNETVSMTSLLPPPPVPIEKKERGRPFVKVITIKID